MARSLRWKLLAWYALMMCGLACIFGGLLYTNVRRSMEREIDARLKSKATELAEVILPAGGKFDLEFSPEQIAYFNREGEGASHYAIWDAAGRAVDESDPSLAIPVPAAEGSRDRDAYRELSIRGPGGVWLLVGEEVSRERAQLRRLAALAVVAGLAALVLMLAGGWFLTSRALAPIRRMSQAAAAVSASNLSQRIDATRMETELSDLAGAFNDAFDRLQRAFEQQTQFTADASHELRTPLSIVLAQAELALKQPRTEAQYREMIDAIRRAGQRMKGVVEGLLTLARADAGEVRLNESRFDLKELVAETCRMLEPIAAERQISITQGLEPGRVYGDRDRLGEAIANVVSNAIRYNTPGGRVDVTLKHAADSLVVRIADTGPGIPEADRALIFDRFYRVDKARSRSVDGTGLGLAITKWIVEAHGGSISCLGGAQGGTVFELKLSRNRESA